MEHSRAAAPAARRRLSRSQRRNLTGYLFLLPAYLVFGIFVIWPMFQGLYLSFFNYKVQGSTFAGLDNFRWVADNARFYQSLLNTALYTLMLVPASLLLSLLLSAMIFRLSDRTQAFFKSAFYLPGVVSGVVVAISWKWILSPEFGLLNYLLSLVGLPPGTWLTSPQTALSTLVLVALLGGQGVNIIIILANMGAISPTYYEAARIDGAGAGQIFFRVTIPLLRPTILYLMVTGTIASFQVFDSIYLFTGGGPNNSTATVAYMIYDRAFSNFEFGRASAIATVLFVIVLIISLIQMKLMKEDR